MAADLRPRYPSRYKLRRLKKYTAVESIGFVVITYLIVSYVIGDIITELHQASSRSLSAYSNSLVEAIAARASQARYVILAMVDEAFTDMALNFHEVSLAPHHIDNYLFVGVGNSTCDGLYRQSLACFHYGDDPSASEASEFGDTDFIRKMNFRTDMILEALDANFTVVHSDLDVIFLGNPFDEIKVIYLVLFCILQKQLAQSK